MTVEVLDGGGLARFAEALRAAPRRRLDHASVWAAFAAAFPARPQGRDERAWFRTALDALAADGVLRLPAVRSARWDRTQDPATPTAITVIAAPPPRRDEGWRRLPWHPALAWVPNCRTLPPDQVAFLRRVHDGLRDGRLVDPAPLKYRSLQLTGDEKRLLDMARTALFAPGRLTFEMLGCIPDQLPLAMVTTTATPAVVVFENAGPFEVAARVLRAHPNGPYGTVAFGDGTRIERSIGRLGELIPRPETIGYVGDLDRSGLRIAAAASRAAEAAGLPPIVPAPGMHAAMLQAAAAFGEPDGWPADDRREGAGSRRGDDALLAWLPADVRPEAKRVLQAGRRIPEEVLGPDELRLCWSE